MNNANKALTDAQRAWVRFQVQAEKSATEVASGRTADELAKLTKAFRSLENELDPLLGRQREYFDQVRLLGQALDAGLIDGLERYEELLARLARDTFPTAAGFLAEITEQLTEETRLAGLGEVARRAELTTRRAINEARSRGIELSADEIDQIRRTARAQAEAQRAAEKRREAERRAAEEIIDIWQDARESVQRSLADTFDDLLGGQIRGVRDFWNAFVDIGRRAIAETLAALVFQRGGGVPGFAGGIFGGGGGAGGLGGLFSLAGGGSGGLGDLFGGLTKAIDGLGAKIGLADVGGDFIGPLLSGQTRGLTLSGLLGGAGRGAVLGGALSGLPGLFGLDTSSTGGAVGGGIGQLLAPLAAAIPVVGPFLSAFLGAGGGGVIGSIVGGLFGRKTPKAGAVVTTGGITDINRRGRGDTGMARDLGQTLLDTLGQIAAAAGGSLRQGVTIGQIGHRRDDFVFEPFARDSFYRFGEARYSYDTAEEALAKAVETAIGRGAFEGLSQTAATILRNSGGQDVNQIVANLSFADVYDELVNVGQGSSQAAQALRALNRQYNDAIATARQLGLSEQRLEQARDDAIEKLRGDFLRQSELAIFDITDPLRAALERQRDVHLALLRDAAALGVDVTLIERRIQLERTELLEQFRADQGRIFDALSNDVAGFIREISFGSGSQRSPTDQIASAGARFDDLVARAREGDTVAQAELVQAARELRELRREQLASSEQFFVFERSLVATLESIRDQVRPDLDVDAAARDVPVATLDDAVLRDIGSEIAAGNEEQQRLLASIDERLAQLLNSGGGVGRTSGGGGRFFVDGLSLRVSSR